MKKTFFIFGLLWAVVTQAQTFYLVRHTEKVDDGSKDPVLTQPGQKRAQNIAAMLSHAGIKYIFSTDYQRTQLTAKPLADFLNVEITSYDPSQLPSFAIQLQALDGNALVVGHSNTTPQLAQLLSGQPAIELDESDYDHVFQVVFNGDEVTVNMLKSLPTQLAP